MELFKKQSAQSRQLQLGTFAAQHRQNLDLVSLKISEESRHSDVPRKRVLERYQAVLQDQLRKLEQVENRQSGKRKERKSRNHEEEEEEALLES